MEKTGLPRRVIVIGEGISASGFEELEELSKMQTKNHLLFMTLRIK